MRPVHIVILAALLFGGTATAIVSYRNAAQFGSGVTSWVSATGSASGHGIYWNSSTGQAVMHPEGGPDIAWGVSSGSSFTAFTSQNDVASAGATSTASPTFVDIGDNGATTGWPDWSVTLPATRTYLMRVSLHVYWSGGTGPLAFQLLMDGTAVTGQAINTFGVNAVNENQFVTFDVLVPGTAGAHTFRLQWHNDGLTTTNINGAGDVYHRIMTIYG